MLFQLPLLEVVIISGISSSLKVCPDILKDNAGYNLSLSPYVFPSSLFQLSEASAGRLFLYPLLFSIQFAISFMPVLVVCLTFLCLLNDADVSISFDLMRTILRSIFFSKSVISYHFFLQTNTSMAIMLLKVLAALIKLPALSMLDRFDLLSDL